MISHARSRNAGPKAAMHRDVGAGTLVAAGPKGLPTNKEIAAMKSQFAPTNDTGIAILERLESEVRGYIRSFPILFDRGIGTTVIE